MSANSQLYLIDDRDVSNPSFFLVLRGKGGLEVQAYMGRTRLGSGIRAGEVCIGWAQIPKTQAELFWEEEHAMCPLGTERNGGTLVLEIP